MCKKYSAEEVTLKLKGQWDGKRGKACCPAHNDRSPSLSIAEKNGKLLWHCFAGCSQVEVKISLQKLGLINDPGARK